MAEYTRNYNWYKPSRNDAEPVDTTLSANFESIDSEMKKRETEITAVDEKTNTFIQQLDSLVIGSGTSDAETIQARGRFQLLYQRLDNVDQRINSNTKEEKVVKTVEANVPASTYATIDFSFPEAFSGIPDVVIPVMVGEAAAQISFILVSKTETGGRISVYNASSGTKTVSFEVYAKIL